MFPFIRPDNMLGDNPAVKQIYKTLVQAGYEAELFAGRPLFYFGFFKNPATDAAKWLIQHLDTNKNGKYNASAGDILRPIELFGYSNGGMQVSFLANAIKTSNQFVTNHVSITLQIDPVTKFLFGNGTIPDTVDHSYCYYENHHGQVHLVQPFTILASDIFGIACNSDSPDPHYMNLFDSRSNYYFPFINHDNIVTYAILANLIYPTLEQ